MKYILDIETKPNEELIEMYSRDIKAPVNYKDAEKIEAYISREKSKIVKKMSVSPDFAKVVMVGVKALGEEAVIFTKDPLRELKVLLDGDLGWELITFNGKRFDLPLLIKQAVREGVRLPVRDLLRETGRYSASRHTDLAEVLCMGGDFLSLDKYSQVYLGRKKKDIEFGNVTMEELACHCRDDLAMTEELYDKFRGLFL